MTPVCLEVILHHFYNPAPYPKDTPAVRIAHETLVKENLIEEDLRSRVVNEGSSGTLVEPRTYRVTERGRVFVNALISVPLPVQAWRIPIPDERKPEG
jgi:hypothetical protein